MKKKRVFNAFIGLAGIKDYKKFWKGFEENKRLIHNELQFSNGLNYILSNTKLSLLHIKNLYFENFCTFFSKN